MDNRCSVIVVCLVGMATCAGCASMDQKFPPGQSRLPDYARPPLAVVLNDNGERRFLNFVVRKAQLNTPISPKRVYFQVLTLVGDDQWVRLVVKVGARVRERNGFLDPEGQVLPYTCEWQLRGKGDVVTHGWLCGFIKNLDGTHHTMVDLPQSDLRRSWLKMSFEDVDGDGVREDWTFFVDMTAFDWAKSTNWVAQ